MKQKWILKAKLLYDAIKVSSYAKVHIYIQRDLQLGGIYLLLMQQHFSLFQYSPFSTTMRLQ